MRLLRPGTLALLTCTAWFATGCNDVLAIHPPSDQLLELDAGNFALHDSGTRAQHDAASTPSEHDAGGAAAMMSGSSGHEAPAARDAGTPEPPAVQSDDESAYVWANWPMPNPPTAGLPNPQSFATLSSDHVSDKVTHLEWQSVSDGKTRKWDDAVAYCKALTIGGGNNWRLPSRIELLSLIDYTTPSPTLNSQVFADEAADSFWSSSPFVGARSSAWGVNFSFHNGFVFNDAMSAEHRVRCVR